MNRPRIIELFANIRATLVSFLSIVMFVLLGVGLFLGIRGSAESLAAASRLAFEQGHFHTFDVSFPYGLDVEDLDVLRAVDGVDLVVPCYLSYENQEVEGARHVLTFHSLTKDVDECQTVDGALPTAKGQAAVSAGYAEAYDIQVGDTLSLVPNA